jgi:hypothetical protein
MGWAESNTPGTSFKPEFVSERLRQQVETMAASRTKRVLGEMRSEIEDEVDRLMSGQLVTDRPPARRKKGARHAKGSVNVDVDGDEFPFDMTVSSIANSAKMAALEYGADPHWISAVNVPDLVFPRTRERAVRRSSSGQFVRSESGRKPSGRARRAGYGMNDKVIIPEVWHPGNRPYGFIRRAIENVMRRHGL